MVDADTAFRLGLVQKICDPDKLIDDCVELCTTINRNGRLIAAHTTEYIEDKLLYEIQGYEKGFEVHREYYAHLRQSKDYDEGSAAFSERRKPEFSQEYYDQKTAGSAGNQVVISLFRKIRLSDLALQTFKSLKPFQEFHPICRHCLTPAVLQPEHSSHLIVCGRSAAGPPTGDTS
jgi:hypothetical protein